MRSNLFLAMAVAGVMLTACSKEEERGGERQTAATFTAGIEPHTKAYDATWEKNDQIGITAYEGNGLVEDYQNIKCSFEGDGGSSVDWLPAQTYFYTGTEDVTFSAYYPFSQSVSGFKIPVDGTNQGQTGEQKKIDFLYTSGAGSQASPDVNFRFTHRMAKLVFHIAREQENPNEDFTALNAVLDGVKLKGEFDVSTGVVTASEEPATEFQLTHTGTGENRSVTLIVVPQEQPTSTLTITIGRNVYKANIPFTEALVAGKSYLFNITVKNTSLIVDNSEIADWGAGNGEGKDIDAGVSLPDAVKIGDYFYADGTWGSILDEHKTCIGLVFSTETSQKDKDRNWRNGYVIALKDIENYYWSSATYAFSDESGLTNIPNFNSAYQNLDGYSETTTIWEKEGITLQSDYPAFYAVKEYGTDYPVVLDKTSGWYMPSIGQWCAFIENLGGEDLQGRLAASGSATSLTIGSAVWDKLNTLTGDDFSQFTYYASSSEYSASSPWSVFFSRDEMQLYSANRKYSTYKIRPVLAF